jgi:hypothetical protein
MPHTDYASHIHSAGYDAADRANIGFSQPASNTRHDSGSARFTLVSGMHAWTYLQMEVLDEVHLGCHIKQQKVSACRQKGASGAD